MVSLFCHNLHRSEVLFSSYLIEATKHVGSSTCTPVLNSMGAQFDKIRLPENYSDLLRVIQYLFQRTAHHKAGY